MKPSAAVSAIRNCPFGSALLFRTYSKLFATLTPPAIATTFYGARLKCDPRDLIQRAIALFGVWEPRASEAFVQIVRPGDVVVDVGANIGYFSLLAASLAGERGNVVAIEASPSIFHLLEANVARNGARNVRLVHCAASDRAGELRVYKAHRSNIGRTTTDEKSGLPLESATPAFSINDLITPAERARVSLIKIDVEGGELPIMDALLSQIDMYPPALAIIVETSPDKHPEKWRDTFARMRASGFLAYEVPNNYELSSYLSCPANPVLKPLPAMPGVQSDILFRRMPVG